MQERGHHGAQRLAGLHKEGHEQRAERHTAQRLVVEKQEALEHPQQDLQRGCALLVVPRKQLASALLQQRRHALDNA